MSEKKPITDCDDKELGQLILNGSESAFKELFRRYYSSLFYFARRRVQDEDLVRDLLQDVFLKLWAGRENLDENKSIKSFLFTITNNLIIDHFRKTSSHHVSFDDLAELISFRADQVSESESERAEQLRLFIDQLPEPIQAVYFLSKYEGYKNQEIAEILGISVKTVEARMTRLIKAVRGFFS